MDRLLRNAWLYFCLFFIVFIVPPLIIILTLSFAGLEPRFYIQKMYIPALNDSSKSNNSIFIDLKFKRVLATVPINYQDINITLFYSSNRSFSVGYTVVPSFYQGRKKTVHRKAVVEARGLPWEDAFHNISDGSTVALTAELATKYVLRRCDSDGCSYSKPKAVLVAAEVRVDASGRKLSNKAIKLH